MASGLRSHRTRGFRPILVSLEERALLNAAMPTLASRHTVSAQVLHAERLHPLHGPVITILNTARAGGYRFLNFDGPNPGTAAGAGTNMNGISNKGNAVGFTIANNGDLSNFAANPFRSRKAVTSRAGAPTTAMAFGINSVGTVVGSDGHGNAFADGHGFLKTFIPPGGSSATAFGINDHGMIVGTYATGMTTSPGFVRFHGNTYITINAPSGPNVVNAQGINNKGTVVGFYVGNDTQVHGFIANLRNARNGAVTGTPIADPVIPANAAEPGATFVFSQILGINDHGIAVGYYGDSTTSQHGFIYNTHTGQYTFLDDPNAAFHDGVVVTQITGITNSGEITGFYSDANGVFHGFVSTPTHL